MPPASPVPGWSSGEVWTLSMATRRGPRARAAAVASMMSVCHRDRSGRDREERGRGPHVDVVTPHVAEVHRPRRPSWADGDLRVEDGAEQRLVRRGAGPDPPRAQAEVARGEVGLDAVGGGLRVEVHHYRG